MTWFKTILAVVEIIAVASTKRCENRSQSNHTCLELAKQVKDLYDVLRPCLEQAHGTAPVQETLKDALAKAFRLIKYCQEGGIFSGKNCCMKVTELEAISNPIMDLIMSIWPSISPQHAGSTSQSPVLFPGSPSYPACPARYSLTPTHHSAPNSSSALPAFAGSVYRHSATSSEEESRASAAVNRALEDSRVSTRAEEAAAVNRAVEESRTSAAVNRALQESRVSARAEEAAAVNRALEESRASAAVNRALEESRVSARAEEAAAVNRVMEESRKFGIPAENMLQDLCNIFQREEFH